MTNRSIYLYFSSQFRTILLFLLLFFTYSISLKGQIKNQTLRALDSLQLVSFYDQMNGKNWVNKWDLEESMDNWFGIHLNNKGRVICIDLDGNPDCSSKKTKSNNLKGTLPNLQLNRLEKLLLAGNKINGFIPNFYGMPRLKAIDLSCNQLSGKIPNFSHLKRLENLELDYNDLEGSIPSLIGLKRLRHLYLTNNKLTGVVPDFQNTQLESILLYNNKLIGQVPTFQSCKKLERINIRNNNLAGAYPNWKHLSNLLVIDISSNKISSKIGSIKKHKKLQYFDVSNNQLIGVIPHFNKHLDLITARFQNNGFTQIQPNDTKRSNYRLVLKNNKIPISNLAENIHLAESLKDYIPQSNPYPEILLSATIGETLLLEPPTEVYHKSNKYEWFKDNVPMQTKDQSQNESSLYLDIVSEKEAGNYVCKISNTLLPGYSVESNVFVVDINITTINTNKLVKEIDYLKTMNTTGQEKKSDYNYLLNLCSNNQYAITDLNLTIFDVEGRIIQQFNGGSELCNFKTISRAYSNGIYYFALQSKSTANFLKKGSFAVIQ